MSVKPLHTRPLLIGLALCLPGLGLAAQTQPIWSAPLSEAVRQMPDYRELNCPDRPIAPYTGPLQLESKYVQTDVTKSTQRQVSRTTTEVRKQINDYLREVVRYGERAGRAETPDQAARALACLDQWLSAWAEAGALETSDVSKTGIAARKWALAAISSLLMKTQAQTGNRFELRPEQRQWLDRLARIVIAEYEPRRRSNFRYFNNHDYWAAWAVTSTGLVLDDRDKVDWGTQYVREALDRLTRARNGDYAYHRIEVERGKLGAEYTHYALVPISLLVEAAYANGRPLSAEQEQSYRALATFAARAVLEPRGLPELKGSQSKVPPHKMIWLLPFLSRFPDHDWARRLYASVRGEVDNYSQIGGRLGAFYPNLTQ